MSKNTQIVTVNQCANLDDADLEKVAGGDGTELSGPAPVSVNPAVPTAEQINIDIDVAVAAANQSNAAAITQTNNNNATTKP